MKAPPSEPVTVHIVKPDRIPSHILDQIHGLIEASGGVGISWIKENLLKAFLVGYATDRTGRVVGTVTHKVPKAAYRRKLEALTGWDLSGYLERGYTAVAPGFRRQDVAHRIIKGLIAASEGKKIYVTIRLDNVPALRLTYKSGMSLAALFQDERSGRDIGLFVNQ